MENFQNNDLESSKTEMYLSLLNFKNSNAETKEEKHEALKDFLTEILIQLDNLDSSTLTEESDSVDEFEMLYDILQEVSNTDAGIVLESVCESNYLQENRDLTESITLDETKDFNCIRNDIYNLNKERIDLLDIIKERDEILKGNNVKLYDVCKNIDNKNKGNYEALNFLENYFDSEEYNNLNEEDKELLTKYESLLQQESNNILTLKQKYPDSFTDFINDLKYEWTHGKHSDFLKGLLTVGLNNINPILGIVAQAWLNK